MENVSMLATLGVNTIPKVSSNCKQFVCILEVKHQFDFILSYKPSVNVVLKLLRFI